MKYLTNNPIISIGLLVKFCFSKRWKAAVLKKNWANWRMHRIKIKEKNLIWHKILEILDLFGFFSDPCFCDIVMQSDKTSHWTLRPWHHFAGVVRDGLGLPSHYKMSHHGHITMTNQFVPGITLQGWGVVMSWLVMNRDVTVTKNHHDGHLAIPGCGLILNQQNGAMVRVSDVRWLFFLPRMF